MANKIIVGTPKQNRHAISALRLQGIVDSPIVSGSLRVSTVGTLDGVEVPPGAIVYRIGLWNYGSAITGASLKVGTVGDIEKFFERVSAMDENEIRIAGVVGTNQASVVGGCYFESGGVIQLAMHAGGTDEGSVKLLVWYTGSA